MRASGLFRGLLMSVSVVMTFAALPIALSGCDMFVSGEGTRMENDAKEAAVRLQPDRQARPFPLVPELWCA
jgi:hypothetical protein